VGGAIGRLTGFGRNLDHFDRTRFVENRPKRGGMRVDGDARFRFGLHEADEPAAGRQDIAARPPKIL
jgi:hypothetical protein